MINQQDSKASNPRLLVFAPNGNLDYGSKYIYKTQNTAKTQNTVKTQNTSKTQSSSKTQNLLKLKINDTIQLHKHFQMLNDAI